MALIPVMLAVLAGLLVGLIMGGLGGGGAILTVPVLAYGFGMTAHEATASSLVIVGVGALVGLIPHHRGGHVMWRQGALYGVLGLLGSFLGTRLSAGVDERLLLGMFAALLVVVAVLMARTAFRGRAEGAGASVSGRFLGMDGRTLARATTTATGVGFLTGFFGVGGGFAIVPALTLVLGYTMRQAVGTSLLVIAVNSAASLLFRAGGGVSLDWAVVLPFLLATVAGSLAGGQLMARVPKKALRLGFAAFLLAVAVYTGVRSLV
ncbi:sulfite exporter TauE/SafE family protein [Arthrobacter sp. UM1]|uniref:sulfite exporter TauE/SafE family protein n=1 Tax=Arthrobacter sp. UM1 TaxID=2766776 RepID=UPI001CF6C00B|nr:sulfite exporter TauE/SafE family protein [Arthrobacter sp. UM1]MCB4208914.1 sulfite exporter TauE/SafE family protein [Arthrobacter sp. UM1]